MVAETVHFLLNMLKGCHTELSIYNLSSDGGFSNLNLFLLVLNLFGINLSCFR